MRVLLNFNGREMVGWATEVEPESTNLSIATLNLVEAGLEFWWGR